MYSLQVRRIEFLPLTLTVPIVPALLVAVSWRELLALPVVLAAVLIVVAIQAGNMLNCVADREMDAVYKTRLSRAVYGLGVSGVVAQIAATSAVCALLGTYVIVATQHLDLVVIGAVWAVLGLGYSLPPLHLNGRGIWQLPTLLFAYFILPGVLMLRAFDGPIDWQAVVAVCGFSLTSIGIVVVNHAEDLPEDESYSVRTYVRALGLTVALVLGVVMVGAGAALVVWMVSLTVGPSWAMLPYLLACLLGMVFVARTALSVGGKPIAEAVGVLRERSRLAPLHSCLVGWTTVLLAGFVFMSR